MDQLDRIEELTEDFAHAMIDLADELRLAKRDAARARFADTVRVRLPSSAELPEGPAAGADPLVARVDWRVGEAYDVPRDAALDGLLRWLAGWREVRDLRLKPGSFDLLEGDASGESSVRGGGTLKIDVRGRDRRGRRQWLHAKAHYEVRGRRGQWRLEAVAFESAELVAARHEIFNEVGAAAGLDRLGRQPKRHCTEGVAAADVDGDGLADILAQSAGADGAGLELYLNQGDGTFRDVAREVGLGAADCAGNAALLLDLDNDGDRDLFLCGGCYAVYESRLVPDGALRFVHAPDRVVGAEGARAGANGASAADVNGDGVPDVFCGVHGLEGNAVSLTNVFMGGARGAPPHKLFLSQPNGVFRESAAAWGVANTTMVLASQLVDVNEDGRPDLIVGNDFLGGTHLYLHDTDKFVFSDQSGLQRGGDTGLSVADYDRDGHLDVHVTRMSSTAGSRILGRLLRQVKGPLRLQTEPLLGSLREGIAGCVLYRGLGGGRFASPPGDVGQIDGGLAWGGGFLDLDNDGWDDIWVPNGFISGKRRADT